MDIHNFSPLYRIQKANGCYCWAIIFDLIVKGWLMECWLKWPVNEGSGKLFCACPLFVPPVIDTKTYLRT